MQARAPLFSCCYDYEGVNIFIGVMLGDANMQN